MFQVPSNRILSYVGGVTWLAFLSIAWGLSTCGMALINDIPSFWAVRCVLGLFEAGFYPGTIVYLRSFFGQQDFGYAYALTLSSTCFALAIGGPIIAGIEEMSRAISPTYEVRSGKTCLTSSRGAKRKGAATLSLEVANLLRRNERSSLLVYR